MSLVIALIAHDAKKEELVAWAREHTVVLSQYELVGTGTTSRRLSADTDLVVTELLSGPLGGDAQIGAMISEGKLDGLVFFIDPLSALPHDVDVKSLQRLAVLYNTLLATNESTASAIFGRASMVAV